MASSADGTKLVAVACGGLIWTSPDSGMTWTAQAGSGNRNWWSVASSADGGKLVAAVEGGQIWTSAASLVGASGTAVTLQYVGNGQWQPLNEQIASGAVGSSQIATGAVTSAQLASNLTVSGTLTAGGFRGSGVLPWQTVAGVTQQAAPNTGYGVTNGASQVTVTLPASPNLWDIVRVSGAGAGGWQLAQNAGQSVLAGSAITMGFGVTWTPRASSQNWCSVASSADGTMLVAAVDGGHLYTSTDSGATWTPRASTQSWESVALSSYSTPDFNGLIVFGYKLVAGTYDDHICASPDAGLTWTNLTQITLVEQAPTPNVTVYPACRCMVASANGSELLVLAYDAKITDGFEGGLWISSDSGATWGESFALTSLGSEGPLQRDTLFSSVASSADGTKLVAVGNEIWTSTDAGATWTEKLTGGDWTSVASSADGTKLVAVGTYIWISPDAGVTWTQQAGAPSNNWASVASSADGSKLVAVATAARFGLRRIRA